MVSRTTSEDGGSRNAATTIRIRDYQEREREEINRGVGSDHVLIGNDRLACMISYFWNCVTKTRQPSRISCRCPRDVPLAANKSGSKLGSPSKLQPTERPCGAFDGKHVNCKCPPNSCSLYYNYLLHCSHGSLMRITISSGQASVVWDQHQTLRSTMPLTGNNALKMAVYVSPIWLKYTIWPNVCVALIGDGDDFNEIDVSLFSILFPTITRLYLFVGDDAFVLRPKVMKQNSLRNMTHPERILN